MTTTQVIYKAVHIFCGIGGGALGFQNTDEEYRGIHGKIETICGIDSDPEVCQDFRNITGARAEQVDLFSREQYIAFHGHEPPETWTEVTPDILREIIGEFPDMIFLSAPCQGFSGLLPTKSAKTEKYQALNELTYRGVWLALEAFKDNLPAVILFENVPRITTRGAQFLKQIKTLLTFYGYIINDPGDQFHDCGEIGGLGQRRKRYLLISRLPSKVSSFVYQPPKQRVKAIGEIIGALPMPGNGGFGKIHELPRLQWKTWVRLALIPAGGDWRDLEDLGHQPRDGAWRIVPWDISANTVTAATTGVGISNGVSAVADPRIDNIQGYGNKYQMVNWEDAAPVVTGSRVGSGAPMVADIRLQERQQRYPSTYKVNDHRTPNRYHTHYKIVPWNETSGTVTGATHVANGHINVQDPRMAKTKMRNGWKPRAAGKIGKWDDTADIVIGHAHVRGAGACNVADPRIPEDHERLDPVPVIISFDGTWHRPLTTLELAALQSFPMQLHDGSPFSLVGNSDARWRKRIGNAVPCASAQAIGSVIVRALLAQTCGDWLMDSEPIWVSPVNNPLTIKVKEGAH